MITSIGGVSGKQLCSLIERIERLVEEKAETSAQIREVFAEAKAEGFDTVTMRQVIKKRKLKTEDRAEQEELLDLYMHALGMAVNSKEDVS